MVGVTKCRVSLFYQAEDGIRDRTVTGVQTCALPISCAAAVSPLRYDDLSRTTVTVIAAGWIGFGVGMAFAVGITAARARSPITNANASAQALDSRADDMRRPIPVSAGRNPADAAASCLTYLTIWSDECPTVFDRGFGGDVQFRMWPSLEGKTRVQDPTAGVGPPPWRRAKRSSARARHGAASPPRPWVS